MGLSLQLENPVRIIERSGPFQERHWLEIGMHAETIRIAGHAGSIQRAVVVVVGYFELRARRHAQTAHMLTASVTAQFPSKPSQRVRSGPTYPASSLNANGKPYWYTRQSKQLGRPQNASISTNRATLKPMTVTHL